MKDLVASFIKDNNLMQADSSVLVGVSGGADSVCLLLLLKEYADKHGGTVYAVHVNHCIRGAEADADEEFVRGLCVSQGVELEVRRTDVPAVAKKEGISVEEAGRNVRLKVFRECAEKFGCAAVATAHHKDDAAETVLMNILRGSGIDGLSGLRASRKLDNESEIRLIRPLLCVTKDDIKKWLVNRGQMWCEDSTNSETDVVRNRVRLEAMPLLEDIRPGVKDRILRLSEIASATMGFVEREAQKVYEASLSEGWLKISELQKADTALLPYVIRRAIAEAKGDLKDIEEVHVGAICRLVYRTNDGKADLPGLRAVRKKGALYIGEPNDNPWSKTHWAQPEDLKMRIFNAPSAEEYPTNSYTKWFDYDKISQIALARHRQSGDYLIVNKSERKLLRRWFIDEKIDKDERDSVTVLADGSHVMWIVGGRMSDYYKVGPDTVKILEVRVEPDSRED